MFSNTLNNGVIVVINTFDNRFTLLSLDTVPGRWWAITYPVLQKSEYYDPSFPIIIHPSLGLLLLVELWVRSSEELTVFSMFHQGGDCLVRLNFTYITTHFSLPDAFDIYKTWNRSSMIGVIHWSFKRYSLPATLRTLFTFSTAASDPTISIAPWVFATQHLWFKRKSKQSSSISDIATLATCN